MSEYKNIILDAITGEETKIEFSPDEFLTWDANRNEAVAESNAREADQLEKAEARSAAEAKLLALGLTSEDLKALLG